MIKGTWPVELSHKVKLNWSIIITTDPSQLYKANIEKVITQIKKDLERWEILPLSLFGRVETIRMNVLPRLLYLFMSLPIKIPATTFKNIQKMLSSFIWQKKKNKN